MELSLRETMSRDKRLGTTPTEITVVKKRKLIKKAVLLSVFDDESYFDRIPIETVHHIFSFMSGNDVSLVAMASKKMAAITADWVLQDSLITKIVQRLPSEGDKTVDNPEKWRGIALVAKRASFLMTVSTRLQLLFQLIEKVQKALISERVTMSFESRLLIVGYVLHKFIVGWDHTECTKVFRYFMHHQKPIKESLQGFMTSYGGSDRANEVFLRTCFQRLFLDHLKFDSDQAIWLNIFYQHMRMNNFSKLLILLYGPNDVDGSIKWEFAGNTRSFEEHLSTYNKLAKAVGILQYVPHWSPNLSLEVLVYLSNCPKCWLLRSFSALLLPLSCINMNLVVEYFLILYNSGRSSTASLLIALVIMISQYSIRFNQSRRLQAEDVEEGIISVDETCVHRLITAVTSSPRLTVEKRTAVRQIWESVAELADDFADSAVEDGFDSEAYEDFHDLMNGWSALAATLMSRE